MLLTDDQLDDWHICQRCWSLFELGFQLRYPGASLEEYVQGSGPRLRDIEIRGMAGVVVEVKSEDESPAWLRLALAGHGASGYSKSRYALALRDGPERPFLIVERPATAICTVSGALPS